MTTRRSLSTSHLGDELNRNESGRRLPQELARQVDRFACVACEFGASAITVRVARLHPGIAQEVAPNESQRGPKAMT
jgi:hypothetical protein